MEETVTFPWGCDPRVMFHCLTSMHIQSAQLDFVDNHNHADADSNNKDMIRNLEGGKLEVLEGVGKR